MTVPCHRVPKCPGMSHLIPPLRSEVTKTCHLSVHSWLQLCILKVMDAIIYTRVSTGKQVDGGLSLVDQLEATTSAVESRGWTVVHHATDEGRSGKRADNRHGLQAALTMLDAGEAKVLVVAKLDRLARSTVDLGRLMVRAEKHGWDLVLLDLDIDTSTPAGRLILRVIGAVAEYESDLIADRARMTHRQLKAAGKRSGQKPILSDEVRNRVVDARNQGQTFGAIAAALNDEGIPTARGGTWHPSTVRHVVQSVEVDRQLEQAS